ncbi:MAG: hypothetical protein ACO3F3_15790, partial [Gemmataceae bacterium]
NYSIPSPMLPIITFGEDEQGEVYFAVVSANGRGIYRLATDVESKSGESDEIMEGRFKGKVRSILNRLRR